MKKKILENIKTIIFALIIAIFIRSLLFQPFYIPSSSMEPNLLVGDRLFVSKYSYGYSKHSFPFSPKIYNSRIFSNYPARGDVIVFKTPADNRTDYIKRLIGLPGDTIQFIDKELYLNGEKIIRKKIASSNAFVNCGNKSIDAIFYEEILPNGKKYIAAYRKVGTMSNSNAYIVPEDHYFFMGDNRDCSKDSRFLSSVGYVNLINLVGKARIIFFSSDYSKGSLMEFWKWGKSIRFNRILKKIN
jgi:signal peptidase I